MEIARLNIRQTMPRIGIRSQLPKMESHATPARAQGDHQQAKSGVGVTQPKIDIDTYASRHSYGYTNHEDFAHEKGREGVQKMREEMAHNNAQGMDSVENAAKRGRNVLIEQVKQEISSRMSKQSNIVAAAIPDPTIRVTPSRVVGENDPGRSEVTFDTDAFAQVQYRPGSVETYLEQKGDIRRWITWGKYDIYA